MTNKMSPPTQEDTEQTIPSPTLHCGLPLSRRPNSSPLQPHFAMSDEEGSESAFTMLRLGAKGDPLRASALARVLNPDDSAAAELAKRREKVYLWHRVRCLQE